MCPARERLGNYQFSQPGLPLPHAEKEIRRKPTWTICATSPQPTTATLSTGPVWDAGSDMLG